jgi:hypothetical protein
MESRADPHTYLRLGLPLIGKLLGHAQLARATKISAPANSSPSPESNRAFRLIPALLIDSDALFPPAPWCARPLSRPQNYLFIYHPSPC